MREYKFRDTNQVISYVRFKNPARQKSVNLLEAEFGTGSNSHDETTDWCIIAKKTFKVLASFDGSDNVKRVAFEWFYFAPESPNIKDIAVNFSRSESTIWRWLNDVHTELARVYRALGILPPADKWEQDSDEA